MNTEFPIRPIGIVVYPGIGVLDIAGPYEVFTSANLIIQKEGISQKTVYPVTLLAEQPGPVETLYGLQFIANQSFSQIDENYDTLIIPGALPEVILANVEVVDLVKVMFPKVRRLASVCTGAFLLAESGLLDGRRATTHWNWCAEFAEKYPQVTVEPDRIFVKDDNIYTSGGISSGIDLALEMVQEDWGQRIALAVAQFIVVFLKRPGGQSQFSSYLAYAAASRNDLRDIQSWIIQNPKEDLKVDILAKRMTMSSRNFARLFLSETGITPAKFVELVRIDVARNLLELTKFPIDIIADSSGFKDPENMRRAFMRQLGVNPRDYRNRFGKFTAGDLPSL